MDDWSALKVPVKAQALFSQSWVSLEAYTQRSEEPVSSRTLKFWAGEPSWSATEYQYSLLVTVTDGVDTFCRNCEGALLGLECRVTGN